MKYLLDVHEIKSEWTLTLQYHCTERENSTILKKHVVGRPTGIQLMYTGH